MCTCAQSGVRPEGEVFELVNDAQPIEGDARPATQDADATNAELHACALSAFPLLSLRVSFICA